MDFSNEALTRRDGNNYHGPRTVCQISDGAKSRYGWGTQSSASRGGIVARNQPHREWYPSRTHERSERNDDKNEHSQDAARSSGRGFGRRSNPNPMFYYNNNNHSTSNSYSFSQSSNQYRSANFHQFRRPNYNNHYTDYRRQDSRPHGGRSAEKLSNSRNSLRHSNSSLKENVETEEVGEFDRGRPACLVRRDSIRSQASQVGISLNQEDIKHLSSLKSGLLELYNLLNPRTCASSAIEDQSGGRQEEEQEKKTAENNERETININDDRREEKTIKSDSLSESEVILPPDSQYLSGHSVEIAANSVDVARRSSQSDDKGVFRHERQTLLQEINRLKKLLEEKDAKIDQLQQQIDKQYETEAPSRSSPTDRTIKAVAKSRLPQPSQSASKDRTRGPSPASLSPSHSPLPASSHRPQSSALPKRISNTASPRLRNDSREEALDSDSKRKHISSKSFMRKLFSKVSN